MKLIRSDSPEVVRNIASASVLASWHWPAFVYGLFVNLLILLIALTVGLIMSIRTVAWLVVPVFLAWNMYVLWLTKSSRRNWRIVGCADRVYIRLGVNNLEVIMLEVSETASMSIRTVEVFLYGPKPKLVEWLVIEPAQVEAEGIPDQIRSFLRGARTLDPGNLLRVADEEGHLTIGWKWCQPALRMFLQQVAREYPSVFIGPEERSELDLNGIWRGISLNLDARKRQLLVQAKCLGFGSDCRRLLSRYKYISFQKAAAYLAKIEEEEAGTEHAAVQE